MSITVQLPKFEGPLGLLLYLIRKEEMDIMDINIHDITKQYFDFIKLMKELDLEVAGEFIAMASTLIQIKSRMLLPQYNEQGEVVDQEDPRKELVQKLLEYQKYQEAAKLLYERPLIGRDMWLRGIRETLETPADEIILEENALFSLIGSYRRAVKTMKKKIHQVAAKAQSISSRILELKDRLIIGHKVTLMELITTTEDRARQTLITFLSLLELGKLGFVGLYQVETYADIWVDPKKNIEADVLTRVEDYEGLKPQAFSAAAKFMLEDEDFIDDKKTIAQVDLGEQLSLTGEEANLESAEFLNDGMDETEEIHPNLMVHGNEIIEFYSPEEEIATDEEILAAEQELLNADKAPEGESNV